MAPKTKTPRVLSRSGRGTAEAIRPIRLLTKLLREPNAASRARFVQQTARYLPNPLTIQMIQSRSLDGQSCLGLLALDHLLSKLPDMECSKYRALEKRLEQIF